MLSLHHDNTRVCNGQVDNVHEETAVREDWAASDASMCFKRSSPPLLLPELRHVPGRESQVLVLLLTLSQEMKAQIREAPSSAHIHLALQRHSW